MDLLLLFEDDANPRAACIEILKAASISFDASTAAAFAAPTAIETVPSLADPVPPMLLTASLWARNTSCDALGKNKGDIPYHLVLEISMKKLSLCCSQIYCLFLYIFSVLLEHSMKSG